MRRKSAAYSTTCEKISMPLIMWHSMQSQKKRTVESCVSFAEECRYMNFVVYFILPMRLVTMCEKPHSKISHGSLAILRSLSTSKVTKIHPLRKLESSISFFWECILAKLGLDNAPGDNMQKTPFHNSPPFSHSFKMFECMSQGNCEIRNPWQFSLNMVSERVIVLFNRNLPTHCHKGWNQKFREKFYLKSI